MPSTRRDKLTFEDPEALQALCGTNNARLKLIERTAGVELHLRGNEITIDADEDGVEVAKSALEQLYAFARQKKPLASDDVVRAVKVLRADRGAHIADIFGDAILTPRAGRPIAPKGLAQKHYVDAVRANDIVFAVGPAGTGKTYLAMALAVRALLDKQCRRIILTRPAVEAGEKLGFLPGTLEEKVDPYLRPLYDALHDMLDHERVTRLIADDVIEVAPLAFMRGRAQPDTAKVLTHEGWREIASLEVGDYVIGSDGASTQVLGVYPQGEKEIYRVTATDGSSTLCCAEHLWAVSTPADKRRRKGPRILQTSDMVGKLRAAHQHRFELPMLAAPVRFAATDVPMDPYALGLLLGDGCITGKTTPTFATRDQELVVALGDGLGASIQVSQKTDIDYVLRHPAGGRGGRRIANPVTAALRDLGLSGTYSNTKFVPDQYLYNSADVRLAVLQGLLDTDGGPVTQKDRTCRIQYVTTSPRLRDDVVFLVRSLGGVAYCRTRRAEGRRPGHANGHAVPHRTDSHNIDIRLPAGIEPFRLARKSALYAKHGAGRPMRFIQSIEPAGRARTRCIRVAAADSLYVTDDFLLTHNTLNDCFVILDEAQNTSPEQMKMFLTRLGFGGKSIINGDPSQTDLPRGMRSGLRDALDLLSDIRGIAVCRFDDTDVVRHPLVADIIRAYDRRDHARTAERERAERERAENPDR